MAQKNRLILPALELAYIFAAIAHAPRRVIVECMIPHVYQALRELDVLETNGINGSVKPWRNNKVTQKNHNKMRSKAEGRVGYWDDLCLARFLEGVCWRFVAYPVRLFILPS